MNDMTPVHTVHISEGYQTAKRHRKNQEKRKPLVYNTLLVRYTMLNVFCSICIAVPFFLYRMT